MNTIFFSFYFKKSQTIHTSNEHILVRPDKGGSRSQRLSDQMKKNFLTKPQLLVKKIL